MDGELITPRFNGFNIKGGIIFFLWKKGRENKGKKGWWKKKQKKREKKWKKKLGRTDGSVEIFRSIPFKRTIPRPLIRSFSPIFGCLKFWKIKV